MRCIMATRMIRLRSTSLGVIQQKYSLRLESRSIWRRLDKENKQLSKYGDTKSTRAIMLVELKKLIEANPLFRDKLELPQLKNSRSRTLINQRLIYLLNVLPVAFLGDGHAQDFSAPDGLAKNCHMDLKQGSFTMSMDFHLVQQTLLLGNLVCPYTTYLEEYIQKDQ